ncbi:hypothetical protein BH20ACT11_BH20ACT11_08830 [soil metagenome]|jgi:uncharacterized membrane protein (DUF373 family)
MEGDGRTRITRLIDAAEKVVYYVAALFLLATVVLVFVAAGQEMLSVLEKGLLPTALSVLDSVLLIFIFAELLSTISTIVKEREIVAEPFLLIGIIAVVRRILAVTVSIEQSLGTPEFRDLLIELGVLTALVVALSVALYFNRKANQSD